MAAVYPALLSLMLMALTLTSYHRYSSHGRASTSSLSKERGAKNLTVYAMAVGQGDGNIILCPNGKDIVIVDMGSSQPYANESYGGYLLEKFRALNNIMDIHIVITHSDLDHYSFLPDTFHENGQLIKNVKEIVLGSRYSKYMKNKRFLSWLNKIRAEVPVYTVNDEHECFGNSECIWTPAPTTANYMHIKKPTGDDLWQFCGEDVHITVLGANICENTGTRLNNNACSIVIKLVYKDWSLFLSGDLEGVKEQKKLIERSKEPLQSTYYKVAHHGAWTTSANLPKLLRAVCPKRAYVSSAHPLVSKYSHPRCEVFDHLKELQSIDQTDFRNGVCTECCRSKLRRCSSQSIVKNCEHYPIYETCHYYDYKSGCQICQDIEITTDGYSDYTVYRSVPDEYVKRSSINCQRPQ